MKKKSIFIFLIIFIICLIGLTFSFFMNSTKVVNDFYTGNYSIILEENFQGPSNWKPGNTIDKSVYVTNNSDTDIAVRISYVEEWKDKNNNILSNVQNGESVAIINFSNNNDWIYSNGYYYYRYKLNKNDVTSSFIDSVTFNENINYSVSCSESNNKNTCKYSIGEYENATYKLTVNIETIQFNMYKNIWNTNIDLVNN